MRNVFILTLAAGLFIVGWTMTNMTVQASDGEDNNIAMLDNCDPTDPAWAPTGGCALKKGDVRVAEFRALLFSPLGPGGILIGHPSWRIQSSHTVIETGETLRVANRGGRTHTFTEVANFGGGRVPPLNGGLGQAQECLVPAPDLLPGARKDVTGLGIGLHKFQCCIHPWMRATVRVVADN